jgi:hypothetical protein
LKGFYIQPEVGGARNTTVAIVVAVILALISIFLYLDVSPTVKIALILVLATVGILNFVAVVGWTTRLRRRLWNWRQNRRIRTYPDLIADLYRLNRRIHKALYERITDYPSLAMKGLPTIQALSKELGDYDSTPDDFKEKFDMMETIYTPTWSKIVLYSTFGHRWMTPEFAEMLGTITAHLYALEKVFKTIYREAGYFTERENPIPVEAQTEWKDFVREFNPLLSDWKTFTEKVGERVGSGGVDANRLELAKDI